MVLSALRQATSSLHHEVESSVDFLSPDLTVFRYIQILQAFYAFFEPVEAEMYARCPAVYRALWQGRRRAHRLAEDLAALQSQPIEVPPGSFIIPNVTDTGNWLGALYVLEGSTLGGQVISRHLEKHFGWSEGRGYSFFRAHGDKTGQRWREVVDAIEAEPEETDQIVSGALQTFNQLNRCFASLL